jgi:PST family polysaccharide transporter
MDQVGRRVASGAIWMVGLKFIERGIGFVSTLVLARLLLPADFGLVAMAMAVYAFIEIAGSFGFDVALIRDHKAGKADYDSAWTLQVGYAVFAGLAVAALALPSATFFREPRLPAIMFVLAGVAFLQGFENIGIVNFRKEFNYGRDFKMMVIKKIISFVVTLSLAFSFRSYWALIGGIVVSRLSGVVLSYTMHPYRPRFDVSRIGGLLRFSRWIVLTRVIQYFGTQGPAFLLGRMLDASSLGMYRVGREVATLPTTELLYPIMRAVFPGYAAVAHDRQELARSFLAVQGLIVMLMLPAACAVVLLADPIVRLLLGPNWLPVIPLIQILGIYGALTAFQATNVSIFHVMGVPRYAAALKIAEVAILLPAMFAVLWLGHGVLTAAWCTLLAQALVIPAGMLLISRLLGVGWIERAKVVWRSTLAAAVMMAGMAGVMHATGTASHAGEALFQIGLALPVGIVAFVLSLYGLWRAVGAPDGPERRVLDMLRERLGHSAPAAPTA